ncbi:sodium channel protein type 2 subunit alpha isoform X1 [Anopheles sinensis]|uniref:Sodium channel protein type 2 subunit alpha isoform X1 n=1 Tax=Anopheles sinensis TaxID=74873 RepID=A0A084WFH7_ANOSI|nr:sodium channel protein type 2 subunit alpha isoform X1 [Anopheles sinensis]
MILKDSDGPEMPGTDRHHRPKRSVEGAEVEGVIAGEQRFAGLALEGQPSTPSQNLVSILFSIFQPKAGARRCCFAFDSIKNRVSVMRVAYI